MKEFDVVVIGGGPGGYVAAIKAAQLGKSVACIEKRGSLGGTCLNVGCIPSKALLHSSHKYHEFKHGAEEHGINVKDVSLSLDKMMERKRNVVSGLTKGIEGLFAKNKITYLKGYGKLLGGNEVEIALNDGGIEKIKAGNIILATGSDVVQLPGIEIDEKKIVSSTGVLELTEVPKKLVVIGAGYIGLEMGSVWSRLGAEVTVVEFAPRVLPGMDGDVSKEFQKILDKQGIKFKLSTKVLSAKNDGNSVKLELESVTDGKKENLEADIVLVSVGRKPFTANLGLENIGIKLDERGRIPINDHFETSIKNIYAIGDAVRGAMLAHKAEEEGVAVAEIIAGQHGHVNYDAIPGVVYTYPEVASVGKTEDQIKSEGIEYKVGKFPFLANSRARANGETDGFVKLIADKKTDRILGAHIIGVSAGELIQELVVGMEYKAASEDIARTSHGHPGLSEAVKEAALATYFKPIHM
ncbi:Dihydrolipoyl dehydrogenase 1, mitochondrial [Candidatus Jidaibacter acanthamoeba]|uniref:Dihydrolipoyl dehydrogenase n=1 Tax=Candidatus Jidaibacter acanthamoebae TaxID=86105 RepID=A0A0C1QH82_9RICK|nr:dihydrolipoyl dehydrogenase [Candidatus Jidaibacter acanthamoeba]KIE04909.1 Dihydrolipoyl dehydrogenase 1, mitochondrial [Candidatus Jidaibacter acanthamoeba]